MQLAKDLWRCVIVPAPMAEIIGRGSVEGYPLHWLPMPAGLAYLADPFGYWRDGRLYVFVEAFDYRTAVGTIAVLVYDAQYRLIDQRPVLAEPWHLSYPIVFDADGATWMLPEAHQSGGLTLYRAEAFPDRWVRECVIQLDHVAIDATPLFHDGLWWLFYASADRPEDHLASLHVAYAERITGPWTPHPANPVRQDIAGSRPGGSAIVVDGVVQLPVQDCARTYGGAIRMLAFPTLDRERCVIAPGARIVAPESAAPCTEGFHTLSAAGPATLVDVKRTSVSLGGLTMRPLRELDRLRARR
ncbi:hypothetical protein FHS99_001689 [Sphingomonas prati]|uniref:Glucosamine inositolphosphorylceramide transferase 1 N-terminal domain-containing protein n=1 Tax=Sphingomonas prati TaxID=1843237 RepID=A0A7W9F1F7_9SPHN|nr:formyl transferase [Sphingomonas prati]MBB5729211.1 hypothetical protein [Sphingomonas prati]